MFFSGFCTHMFRMKSVRGHADSARLAFVLDSIHVFFFQAFANTCFVCLSMSYCCVPLCTSNGKNKTVGLSFHEMPAAAGARERWLAVIRRDNWSPNTASNYTRVCSRHFRTEDFIEGKKRRLKKGAVPSVFEDYTFHVCSPRQQLN